MSVWALVVTLTLAGYAPETYRFTQESRERCFAALDLFNESSVKMLGSQSDIVTARCEPVSRPQQ